MSAPVPLPLANAEDAYAATDLRLARIFGLHAALRLIVVDGEAFNNPSPEASAIRELVDVIGEAVGAAQEAHSAEYAHLLAAQRSALGQAPR